MGFLNFPLERKRMPPPKFACYCLHKSIANLERDHKLQRIFLNFSEKISMLVKVLTIKLAISLT
jgi:hypothetical protein